MSDVFISYSRKNSTFARRLIDRLSLANKDAWVDWEGIPLTAPNWWAEIKAGIDGADSFVFILSPDSMASVVCNMELDYAIELRKRIVPVVHVDVVTRDAFASIADFKPDEAMEERLNGKDPLIIARDNWQRLSHINWVFFREADDFDSAFETLVTTVETNLEYVKAHTRYLVRAQEWQRENQRADLLLFGSEIDRAEAWLQEAEGYTAAAAADTDTAKVVNPLPKDLHRDYIRVSRQADRRRRRLVRGAQLAIAVLILVVIAGFGIGSTIVAQTQQQVADGQATLSSVSTQVVVIAATVTQAAIVEQITSGFANAMLQQPANSAAQIASMDALVQRYPNQPIAWHSRGLTKRNLGEAEGAIADYDEAIRLNPDDAIAYNSRGIAKADLNDLEGAIADYDEAIRLNPELAIAYSNRGLVKVDLGDVEGGIADYDTAIRLAPGVIEAYNNRALAKFNLDDLEGAIADFDAAIRLNLNDAEAYNNRGNVKRNLGDLEGAIADYDIAVRLNPDYASAFYNRGLAKFNLDDMAGTIADYSEAIRLNPVDANAYLGRGLAKFILSDMDGAIADYADAIGLNPELAEAYAGRGLAKVNLGDVEGAIADFDEAIRLNPHDANTYLSRGITYYISVFTEKSAAPEADGLRALSDWNEAKRLGIELPQPVLDAIAEIEAALGITPTPAP